MEDLSLHWYVFKKAVDVEWFLRAYHHGRFCFNVVAVKHCVPMGTLTDHMKGRVVVSHIRGDVRELPFRWRTGIVLKSRSGTGHVDHIFWQDIGYVVLLFFIVFALIILLDCIVVVVESDSFRFLRFALIFIIIVGVFLYGAIDLFDLRFMDCSLRTPRFLLSGLLILLRRQTRYLDRFNALVVIHISQLGIAVVDVVPGLLVMSWHVHLLTVFQRMHVLATAWLFEHVVDLFDDHEFLIHVKIIIVLQVVQILYFLLQQFLYVALLDPR